MDDVDRKIGEVFDRLHEFAREHPGKQRDLAFGVLGRALAMAQKNGIDIESELRKLRLLTRGIRTS